MNTRLISPATLANWRSPPFNRWAFQHVRELIPSAEIANDPRRVREFESRPRELELAQFLAERHYDPVVPILQQMLLQGSDAEAYGAVRSLSELGTPESTAAVIGYLRGAGGRDAGRAREVLNHLLAELAKLPPEKPIDFAALRTVLPEKMEAATAFAYVQLLQRRHEKSGTKELLAIVARGPSDQAFHAAFQALLELGDVAAWTSAAAELDKSGDRNSALQCFGLRMRMTVEALFARMSDAELAKMGSDFSADLKPAEKGNDALGRQYVASGGKGEKASVAIDFENDDGEWRIRFM